MNKYIEDERQSRYIMLGGVLCPICDSEMIEGGPADFNAGTCRQEIVCINCDATWTDTYTLTGYECMELGQEAFKPGDPVEVRYSRGELTPCPWVLGYFREEVKNPGGETFYSITTNKVYYAECRHWEKK